MKHSTLLQNSVRALCTAFALLIFFPILLLHFNFCFALVLVLSSASIQTKKRTSVMTNSTGYVRLFSTNPKSKRKKMINRITDIFASVSLLSP